MLNNILQAVAGLLADAKHLVDNAREEAANYRANYGASIPLKVNATVSFQLIPCTHGLFFILEGTTFTNVCDTLLSILSKY